MDLEAYCPGKVVDATAAVSKISSGSRVFIGTGCGEPQHLIRAMVKDQSLQDMMVYQMLSSTFAEYIDDPLLFDSIFVRFYLGAILRQPFEEISTSFPQTSCGSLSRYFWGRFLALIPV